MKVKDKKDQDVVFKAYKEIVLLHFYGSFLIFLLTLPL